MSQTGASEERARLIDRLIADFRLVEVAEAAAARTSVGERAEAVAYCLVAITIKKAPTRDRVRLYEAPLDEPEYRDRLVEWAEDVARHMSEWEATYTTVQEEFDRPEFGTLTGLVKPHRKDDVIDIIVMDIAAILSTGPRIEQMTLAGMRTKEPPTNAYMFQSPLDAWIATIRGHRLGPGELPIDDDRAVGASDESPDAAALMRQLVKQIAQLRKTRELLADAIEWAGEIDMHVLRETGVEVDGGRDLIDLRAELAFVAHELTKEQRALPGMLAYALLALRVSTQRQRVAVLSLRAEQLERAVIDALTDQMGTILRDPTHPRPALVRKTRAVATGKPVPRNRVKALEKLLTSPEHRAALLAPVEADLTGLPPTVADTAAIASLLQSDGHIVAEQRRAAGAEIAKVDAWAGRVYRRYAMERVR